MREDHEIEVLGYKARPIRIEWDAAVQVHVRCVLAEDRAHLPEPEHIQMRIQPLALQRLGNS